MESEGAEGSKPKWSKPRITSLPQELITAILVRLPVKNILQCKSVSKYWLSLISSPHFVMTHLKFSAKDHRMLLVYPFERKVKRCSFSSLFNENCDKGFDLVHPLKDRNPIMIVGSVNGLICLRNGPNRLILWNPSTRKVKQVPDLIPPDTNGVFVFYSFMYGFGYDEVHDDYKVVAINKHGPAICYICSLKNDSWSNLDVFECLVQSDEWAKFVNGKVHCITATTFTGGDSWGIMSIDLVDEKCGKVELPCYEKGQKDVKLGVLGSDLCMLCTHIRNHERTRHDVWVMKEYGVKESWMKLYSIKYCEFEYYLTAPFYVSNKGEILFVFGTYVMIYNPTKKSIRYPKVINAEGHLWAELYIESLVSPILQNKPLTQH